LTRLSISLLGPFVVRVGDQVLTEFSYDKVRALLAYLTVESAHPSRRERLAGLLWPDLPESKGASNLRTALYDLRNAIRDRQVQPSFLAIAHTTLRLNPDADIWADVLAFRDQVAACEALAPSTPGDPVYEEKLTRAAELYTGEFLHGFDVNSGPFEDWVLMQREALQLEALDVLERLVTLHQGRGDHERALIWARRQVALEPWREQAHRHVMRALAALGQRAAAVAQYERCCLTLRDKLGLEPEAETQALLERIRAGRLDPAGTVGSSVPWSDDPRARGAPVHDTRAPVEGMDRHSRSDGHSRSDRLSHSELASTPLPGLVTRPPWTPHGVERAVRDAEELRRESGAGGAHAAMAAAKAALDMARATGGAGIEALGHFYAGVVLANTAGEGFDASLSHFGRALALAQTEHMPDMAATILRYLGVDLPIDGVDGDTGPLIEALKLYRDLGHRVGEAQLLSVLAVAYLGMGDLACARRYSEEGVALVRELGDRHEEGTLRRVLGIAASMQGQYGEGMRHLQTAMTRFLEIEEPEGEAATLRALGAIFVHLGVYARAHQVLARSIDTLPEGGGPAGILEGWIWLAMVALHTGDDAGALEGVGKALSLLSALGDGSQRSGYPRLRSAALTVRGRVLAQQGYHDEAAQAYREALSVRQRGRWPGMRAEPRAGLAELVLATDGPASALAEIEGLLPYLEADNLTGALDPLRVHLICYRVLQEAQDPRSRQVLAKAHEILLARADSIDDEGLRRAYLEAVAVNREIAAAVKV
jgi:DNA-binding SARP family transcriptional activator